MTKNKDLTIDEYKETLLDEIEEDELTKEEIKENKEAKKKTTKNTKTKKTTRKNKKKSTAEDNKEEKEPKFKTNKIKLIINIVFIILILIMVIISIDVICVARYNTGPFFAIKTKTYKDGGTKVYHGIGYKVIKYNQIQGRRDMEIGTWGLHYSIEPTDVSALDLAIEFTNKPKDTYKKYYKEFLRVNGEFMSKDEEENTLTLGYVDEDGKYTFDIVCTMAEEDSIPETIKENEEVTVIGTVTNYDLTEEGTDKTLYISDCFAE